MARISVARDVQKPQDYISDGSDAIGFLQFWGTSPALDLLNDPQAAAFGPLAIGTSPGQMYKAPTKNTLDETQVEEDDQVDNDEPELEAAETVEPEPAPAPLPTDGPINILIAGGADVRHVLKTVSRRRRATGELGPKLRFYLHETHHEVLARHVLLLQIMNDTGLPIRERMGLFLSLLGNTLVREKDNTYVEEIAKELIEIMTEDSNHPLAEVLDLSQLKFKDRDLIQDVFKGWLKDVVFDVEALRENRCRGYYRDRYDYRKNAMDFDYQTHIKERAGVINWFHYREFCFTGVAFEPTLAAHNTPNRTLASYTEGNDRATGGLIQVRGFWGDIINSPYHTFCTATDPQDWPRLFKIGGSQYRHTETDVATFNVTAFMTEMETGKAYHLPPEKPEEDVFPYASPLEGLGSEGKVVEVTDEAPQDESKKQSCGGYGRASRKKQVKWPPLSLGFEGVEVILLAGPLYETLKKPKYAGMFHRAFVGSMGTVPMIEEFKLNAGGDEPFRAKGNSKIRKPPSKSAPEMFGQRKQESIFAAVMAPGAEVVVETLKYQAHFDSMARIAFRHRVAQAGHLSGWRVADERHTVPRLESDMKERRAGEIEKDASDFIRFVTS